MQEANIPKHFELLNPDDKMKYKKLQAYFIAHAMSPKNCGDNAFQDSITKIFSFCIRHEEEDWKRSVVCGIYWFDDNILLSVQQLQVLLGKSKSSINSSLQRLGYSCGPRVRESRVVPEIPFFGTCPTELRRWTFRKLAESKFIEVSSEDDVAIPELSTEPYFGYFDEPVDEENF